MFVIKNAKILVADDEKINLSLISKILKQNHYTVITAENGKIAIEKARKDKPDLILLDINMPVMSGMEATKIIKQDDELKHIPIIFLSGIGDSESIIEGFRSGAVDYIIKPFNISELLARVGTQIKLKRALLEVSNSEQKWKSIAMERDIFENLFAQSKHGVVITNLDEQITNVNKALLNNLGYSDKDLIGKKPSSLSKDNEKNRQLYKKIRETLKKQSVWTGELEIKKADESEITMLLTVDRLFDQKGRTISYAGTYIETEELNKLKQIQHELEKQKIYKERLNQIIIGLCATSEYSDEKTGKHVLRVNKYSEFIAEKLGFGRKFVSTIGMVAALHDIGKVAIQSLIKFQGEYSPKQRKEMEKHTIYGANIIKKFSKKNEYEFEMAKRIALNHHQTYNGQGYPKIKIGNEFRPLKGKEIPIEALIVSLADVYDALRSKRVYKRPFSHKETFDIMSKDDRTGIKGEERFGKMLWSFFTKYHNELSVIYESNID